MNIRKRASLSHPFTGLFNLGDKRELLMHKKIAFCVHALIGVHTKWQKAVLVFFGFSRSHAPAWEREMSRDAGYRERRVPEVGNEYT